MLKGRRNPASNRLLLMRRLQPVRQRAHNPALPLSRLLVECLPALPANLPALPANLQVLPVSRLLGECLPALPVWRPVVHPAFPLRVPA